jgi:acetyl-CoA C-acetyltransferase
MFASYIVGAARTPRGRGKRDKGALAGIHPQELFAQTLTALQDRVGFEPREVDDVIAGCVSQVGEQGANVARNAVLAAGWPYEVSAVSLNRFCSSGLQAIHFGAMGVASGAMDLVIAGGVESMSRVPMGSDGAGQDGDNTHLRKRVFQIPQGISADLIATLEGFTREDLDAIALRSQRNAVKAIVECRFSKSLFKFLIHSPARSCWITRSFRDRTRLLTDLPRSNLPSSILGKQSRGQMVRHSMNSRSRFIRKQR